MLTIINKLDALSQREFDSTFIATAAEQDQFYNLAREVLKYRKNVDLDAAPTLGKLHQAMESSRYYMNEALRARDDQETLSGNASLSDSREAEKIRADLLEEAQNAKAQLINCVRFARVLHAEINQKAPRELV